MFLTLNEARQHGNQKTSSSAIIKADVKQETEGDAHLRLNRAFLVVERYCKPVTTSGRGERRTRLKHRKLESKIMQIGGSVARDATSEMKRAVQEIPQAEVEA